MELDLIVEGLQRVIARYELKLEDDKKSLATPIQNRSASEADAHELARCLLHLTEHVSRLDAEIKTLRRS